MSAPVRPKRTDSYGRAYAGSQLQMQLYIDRHRSALDSAIGGAIGIEGGLHWVSPVRATSYREFKDGAFLKALGLNQLSSKLSLFWPSSGPRWDGLAFRTQSAERVIILAEAKNYPREVHGSGCKASDVNNARDRIQAALHHTASAIGATDTQYWMGKLYQFANRVAHAQFLREHGVQAYMVNLCFYDDPHPSRSTSEQEWRKAAAALKENMGFSVTPHWLVDVFLPAADGAEFLAAAPSV